MTFRYVYIFITFAVAAQFLFACDGNKSATASGSGTSSVGAGLPPQRPAASYADADLAVPEDFEGEADVAVTRDTYKAELDKLAEEIRRPNK